MGFTFSFHAKKGNSVLLPASVIFTVFLAFLTVLAIWRYSKGTSGAKLPNARKQNGREPRRSTRERKEVARWSPEKTGTPTRAKDSPSIKKAPKTPAAAAVQKVMATTEGVLASPVSAVKKTRLAKSLGATATSPSPPKTRTRHTPAEA